MGVQLYTSRVVLNVLGIDDYGIYSVVGGVVALFSFFNAAMSSATQRFLAIDIGKNDCQKLNKTFNTTLIIHICIAVLVLIIAETLGLWYLNNKLNFSIGRINAVNWLYQFSIFSALIGIMQVPFNALIIVKEKMKVYALMSIVEVTLKLLIVYFLLIVNSDKLILYSILVFAVTLLIGSAYCIFSFKNFEETKFKFYDDGKYYKELFSYSGWNLFGNIASVAKGQGTNVLLNFFFGTVVNASYGIMTQVQSAVSLFITNFQLAVNPQIYKNYAQGNIEQMQKLMFQTSKISYFLVFTLICPIIFNINFILVCWLKKLPQFTEVFIVFILINLLIECLSNSLITGSLATGKIKWYQIVVGSTLFLNLPINYLGFTHSFGPTFFLYVSIGLSLITLILRLVFLKKMIDLNVFIFLRSVIIPVLFVTFLSFLLLYSLYLYVGRSTNFLECIYVSCCIMLINIFLIFFVGLKKSEKTTIFNLIKNRLK